jgi:hypothetical protein
MGQPMEKLHADEQGFHGKFIANTEWAVKFNATGKAAPRVATHSSSTSRCTYGGRAAAP